MNSAASRRFALRGLPLLAALTACEQVIEPDLPEHTPRLVLQAFFTADSTWTAYVGRSAGILESLPESEQPVTDASVELLEGDRVVEELRFLEGEDLYILDENPLEAGLSYSLRVSAPGFAAIRASDILPRPVPTSAEALVTTSTRPEYWLDYAIDIGIQDPPGETNYYQVSLYLVHVFADPEGPDEGLPRQWVRQELLFSTKDPSITGSTTRDEPFEDPTFEGAAPFFKDTLFDGEAHEIELTGSIYRPSGDNKLHLQVLHISGTYYEWLKSARLHDDTRENVFAEPLSVRGNVENGYGIFAGYSSRTFEFEFDFEFDFEPDSDFESNLDSE